MACNSFDRPLPAALNPEVCRGTGLSGNIMGNPADDRLVWLSTEEGGARRLVWPPGWTARFAPGLEVVDESGSVRFREGDHISGVCLKGPASDPGMVLMVWPLEGPS